MLMTFVAVATTIPVLMTCLLLYFIGFKALFILIFALIGPFIAVIYGFVGRKIARLRRSIPAEEGTQIPGLLVSGKIEAAGIVILGSESLIFQPVVGARSQINRGEISSFREVSWFNGSLLIGKTGFWFNVPGRKRFACAVPNSFADEFRAWLAGGGKDVS